MPVYIESAEGTFHQGERVIPNDSGNMDYRLMLEEVADGASSIDAYSESFRQSEDIETQAAKSALEATRQEDIALLKADSQVLRLLKASPVQINRYIDNNVTNLTEAKAVLKVLAKACAVLASTIIN